MNISCGDSHNNNEENSSPLIINGSATFQNPLYQEHPEAMIGHRTFNSLIQAKIRERRSQSPQIVDEQGNPLPPTDVLAEWRNGEGIVCAPFELELSKGPIGPPDSYFTREGYEKIQMPDGSTRWMKPEKFLFYQQVWKQYVEVSWFWYLVLSLLLWFFVFFVSGVWD